MGVPVVCQRHCAPSVRPCGGHGSSERRICSNRLVLIFLYVGINVPYTTIFLLTFFANISRAFEEAAAIDGRSPTKTFWLIMLPMARPGCQSLLQILNFINVWNEYFISLIFGNSDRIPPCCGRTVLHDQIPLGKSAQGDWAGMFAAVIIVFLPTFILYIFLSEKIIAGVTGGGVKG